jgi:hypothetical protein
MANDFLVKGDISAVQDLMNVTAGPMFRDVLTGWSDLGAVKFKPAELRVVPGQKVENPIQPTVGALGATNLVTNTSCDYVQAPGSQRGRGPVISRALANGTVNQPIAWRADALRAMLVSEPEYLARLAADMGKQAARAVKIAAYKALVGAIGAQAAGIRHQKTVTTTPVYTDVIDAQKTLENRRNDLVLGIFDPIQFADLEKNLLTGSNYHVFNVGDQIVYEGLGKFGRMRCMVDPDVPALTVTTTADDYFALMLCEGAVEITAALDSPLITIIETPLTTGVKGYAAQIELHAAINIPGMDYSAAVDGTTGTHLDATLATSGSWAEAYSYDHRDVGACILRSRG